MEKNNDFDDIFDMVKKMFENIISQNPNMDFRIDIKKSDDIAVPEEKSSKDSKAPYSEVIEEKENIMVIVELPGINKEDINLEAGKDDLQISIPNQEPFLIELPAPVQSDHMKAHLTNGILEVELKKSTKPGKKQIHLN
ncbi:MAG: Hsp20/alpha crystallin family protein [Promethearchaeota archaeon]